MTAHRRLHIPAGSTSNINVEFGVLTTGKLINHTDNRCGSKSDANILHILLVINLPDEELVIWAMRNMKNSAR
jgi:hypothetical protein